MRKTVKGLFWLFLAAMLLFLPACVKDGSAGTTIERHTAETAPRFSESDETDSAPQESDKWSQDYK